LIQIRDADEISPAIDYHIMRMYLTGRVVVADDELVSRLIKRKRIRIEVITEIRTAVADALKYTAWLAKISVSTLNDIEWAFARRACRRDSVWCREQDKKCPLDHFCTSAFLEARSMITEPDSRHGHY
jgi:endonuclease III